ncbi:acyl-CoA dehydrogenase family protein [Streptomyces marianii]|uniref:Acyl-CoA dehydrogenase n=1 Tax=Streptomyces marianii TaxID=1817406 RepID=A0A5R9ED09_9ACTN|nr:acyl-CoA dehydrogenase family protein [Streptomyces marianii]TLQ47868.1 acyl-CoA dehydrogenase [Streptomyces marianii]
MSEPDRHLSLLQGQAREWWAQVRPHALDVDRDPTLPTRLLHLKGLGRLATLQIPPAYNPDPLVIAGRRFHLMTAAERVAYYEEAAWGDLATALAAPGAPMSGVLVDALGDREQKDWFYGRLLTEPTWTFFALTEPEHGSDAAAMATSLTRADRDGPWYLNGTKKYVGNAVRGRLGVVFARTGKGPLGVNAALVEAGQHGFEARPVPTLGLRGAQLGTLTMESVEIAPERVLGRHLSPTRRGMAGWLRTFNLLRPVVASMGVGLARAAHEYVQSQRRSLTRDEQHRLDALARRIEGVRRLTGRAAAAVDADITAGQLACMAKLRAARLAEDATVAALAFFGPGARLDHPFLEKLARDARGIEYMEGTENIQRMSVFKDLSRGGHG